MAAALLFSRLSRRLQPPCAALLILAAAQLPTAIHASAKAATGLRGAFSQIAPERS